MSTPLHDRLDALAERMMFSDTEPLDTIKNAMRQLADDVQQLEMEAARQRELLQRVNHERLVRRSAEEGLCSARRDLDGLRR